MVRSLHARLATSVDAADILVLANTHPSCPPSILGGKGEAEAVAASAMDGPSRTSPLPERSVLLLMGFFNGMLEVVGDCEDGRGSERGPAETSDTGHVGFGVGADVQGAVLRSALASLVEFLEDPKAMPGAASPENSGARDDADNLRSLCGRVARDKCFPDPEGLLRQNHERPSLSPASLSVDAAAGTPVRQLVALRFLHEAVRRWPCLTVKLMQQVGLWDFFFSERFLSGGSHEITRAIEGLSVIAADDGRGASDRAVGWGLVYDGTLLLLEAVVVARCLRQFGPEEWVRGENERGGRRAVEGQGSGPARSFEIAQYLSFLAGGENSRRCAIATMQGCRWLRAMVAMESTMGASLLEPQSLRVTALCLAFQLCDRGNCAEWDSRISGELAWPLMHASLSLAVTLVTSSSEVTEGELLFRAAVAYSLDAELALGAVPPAPAKYRAHHPTASLTSDASSPGAHATNAWGNPSSGGSRTPASINSLSPRGAPSVSFEGNHVPLPSKPPRPLPEVFFKAALEPRARRVVFHLAALLGVEADGALASLDVHQQRGGRGVRDFDVGESSGVRETAAAALSGLAEGFLCLCERAAVVTAAGSAAADDGPGLLLDALHGACALMRSNVPRGIVPMGGARISSEGDKKAGFERALSPSRQASAGAKGVPPLLQEAFREHWASARLLVVLESVVGGRAALGSSPYLQSVSAGVCSDIVAASLSLFTAMMAGNSLGKRSFQHALSDHHGRKDTSSAPAPLPPTGAVNSALSFAPLADLASVMPPPMLCHALLDMLLDGEVPACVLEVMQAVSEREGEYNRLGATGRRIEAGPESSLKAGEDNANDCSPSEIRNPFVVPLIFGLLPDWPVSEQENMMRVFRLLLTGSGGGLVNRSLCCDVQPALLDQVRRGADLPVLFALWRLCQIMFCCLPQST